MMHWLSALLFALAVSADGFVVGLAYGARKIKIPLISLLLICVTSMVAIGISMLAGQALALYCSQHLAEKIGGAALITVGLWFVVQAWRNQQENETAGENIAIATLRIKPLGLIIQILRDPSQADLDSSGIIGYQEAFLLGAALALDALGAGMGASLSGFKVGPTIILVGCCKFLMVSLGLKSGKAIKSQVFQRSVSVISGLVLLGLGLTSMMR